MGIIYDTFVNVGGTESYFDEIDEKKILYNLVKNHPDKKTYYSVDHGNGFNQHVVWADKGKFLLQVDERHEKDFPSRDRYIVIINGGGGDYNYHGTERFNELIKKF